MPFLRLLLETIFVYTDNETPIPSIFTHNKILFSKLIIWSVSGRFKLVRYSENDLWDYLRWSSRSSIIWPRSKLNRFLS